MGNITSFLHWLNTKLRPIGLFGRKKPKTYNIYPLVITPICNPYPNRDDISYNSKPPYYTNTSSLLSPLSSLSPLSPLYVSNGSWLPTSTQHASYA